MSTHTYSRQYDAANRISRKYGVHVEYSPLLLGGRYIVDTVDAGATAREAERKARQISAEIEASYRV